VLAFLLTKIIQDPNLAFRCRCDSSRNSYFVTVCVGLIVANELMGRDCLEVG
jgi:hypothetical protein